MGIIFCQSLVFVPLLVNCIWKCTISLSLVLTHRRTRNAPCRVLISISFQEAVMACTQTLRVTRDFAFVSAAPVVSLQKASLHYSHKQRAEHFSRQWKVSYNCSLQLSISSDSVSSMLIDRVSPPKTPSANWHDKSFSVVLRETHQQWLSCSRSLNWNCASNLVSKLAECEMKWFLKVIHKGFEFCWD